ncbi:MAG: HAD-IB family phosphatase [Candidatus Wildermuthbacteria bacterium]|nr:HAD-IB family phosphatase [Candidatus Wildermuthbacteria bacterium]
MKLVYPTFYRVLFVDVDSCITAIEGIDELARLHGREVKVAELTKKAMQGEVLLEEVFEKRLALINPRKEDLQKVAERYVETITPDAVEVIRILVGMGVEVRLISAGYQEAILPLAIHMGLAENKMHANSLYFNLEGEYSGFDRSNPLWQKNGKKKVIESLKQKREIPEGRIAIIGDGVSELETEPATDFRIGFGGHQIRDRVKELADVFIQANSFAALLLLVLDTSRIQQLAGDSAKRKLLQKGFEQLQSEVVFSKQAQGLKQDLKEIEFELRGL